MHIFLFSFRGRISREKWWVAVGLLVVLNVWQSFWQTHEIVGIKKQVAIFVADRMVRPVVWVARNGTEYHRKNCKILLTKNQPNDHVVYWSIKLSEAKQKYDRCEVCDPPRTDKEAILQESLQREKEREDEFDFQMERWLRGRSVFDSKPFEPY